MLALFAWVSIMPALGQQREEFNGPFASWANVKTRFGAKGDGVQDDTRALQRALDSLSCSVLNFNNGKNGYTVVYLPKGRYRITQTLLLRGKIGICIIGEDPANTSIEWGGNDKDTMLWANGSSYFKIGRFTWQGNQKKNLQGIGIHWKDHWQQANSKSFAPVNIEINDCVFKGLTVGIGGGFNMNDSEVKINRCAFYSCSGAGIEIKNHNALDYWIWYCRFYNCNIGVNNLKGNYHLYNSYFSNSVTADIVNDQGYYTSVRGCFSENSTAFSIDKGSSSNPFKRIFQDNVVKQTRDLPIQYYHIGKPTFLGNQFDRTTTEMKRPQVALKGVQASAAAMAGVIDYGSWHPTNLNILSVNNQYYYASPFLVSEKFPRKNYVSGDSYGKRVDKSAAVFLKQLPATPFYVKRPVVEVRVNASTAEIQAAIDRAGSLKGQRPIVHFPFGRYTLEKTVRVPAGSDLQLVGDGFRYASIITFANNFQGDQLIRVAGPSYIEIKEIQFGTAGNKKLTAIAFEDIDQRKSAVHIDQLYSNAETSLLVNRINYTRFEKNNSFYSDGNVIIGGDLQKAGKGTTGVYCFGGQYSRVTVSNNARFVSKDCWWEGETRIPVNLQGDGLITIDGTKIAPRQADSQPIIRIGRFAGKIALMNMYVQGGIELSANNPSLSLFLWNANFYYKKDILGTIPRTFNGRAGYAGITSQCFYKNDPNCKTTTSYNDRFVNVPDETRFIEEMTRQGLQAAPTPYVVLPPGISNIYLSRVTLDSFITGLQFTP